MCFVIAARQKNIEEMWNKGYDAVERSRRLSCLRLLRLHERGQGVLDALANGRLPAELVLRVMEYVVKSKNPVICILGLRELLQIRKLVLGSSKASDKLESLFEEATLKTALVSMDFNVHLDMPPLESILLPLSHPIHALEMSCTALVSCIGQPYPSGLLHATKGIAAIAYAAPRLGSLSLRLTLRDWCTHRHLHSTDWSGIACRTGFIKYLSLRRILEDLVKTLRLYLPQAVKTLTATCEAQNGSIIRTKTMSVNVSMPVEQVLQAAFDD